VVAAWLAANLLACGDDPAEPPSADLGTPDTASDAGDGGSNPPTDVAELGDPSMETADGVDERGDEPLDDSRDESSDAECPWLSTVTEPSLSGMVFRDQNHNAVSLYAQTFESGIDVALGGVAITHIGPDGAEDVTTCADGTFAFGPAAEGDHLIALADPADCTSANCPHRFPEAVRDGQATIVTIGDSLPVVGSDTRFPARLAQRLDGTAVLTNLNVAVGGSTTEDWLPDTGGFFDQRLEPILDEADVVLISLGGNDLAAYFGNNPAELTGEEVAEMLDGLADYLDEISANLIDIIETIQERAPHADVVYCVYLNYGYATAWQERAGPLAAQLPFLVGRLIETFRSNLRPVDDLVLADVYGFLGDSPVDDYLVDEVHLNDLGHQLFADQVFIALGGAVVGEEPLGQDRVFALAP
jgi:lysophospholipase L1-like esterase